MLISRLFFFKCRIVSFLKPNSNFVVKSAIPTYRKGSFADILRYLFQRHHLNAVGFLNPKCLLVPPDSLQLILNVIFVFRYLNRNFILSGFSPASPPSKRDVTCGKRGARPGTRRPFSRPIVTKQGCSCYLQFILFYICTKYDLGPLQVAARQFRELASVNLFSLNQKQLITRQRKARESRHAIF